MSGGRKAKYIRAAASLMLIFVMLLSPFCFAYAEGMGTGAAESITDDDFAGGNSAALEADPDAAPDEITDADVAGGSDGQDKSDSSDDELALIDKVSIPVIVIHIDETKGTIDAMNSDDTHKTECYGTMDIIVPEGFEGYADMDIMPQTIRDIRLDYIRLRGNSTSRQPKKPYKIKLKKPKAGQEPANMLGLGTGRHWALVANVMDPVQIRNRITYRLGEELGFEYNPKCVPVDVIMKSNTDSGHDVYLGTYYLSENIRVDEDRLNITEPGESETSPDKITGDYLIQGGQQTANGASSRDDDRKPGKRLCEQVAGVVHQTQRRRPRPAADDRSAFPCPKLQPAAYPARKGDQGIARHRHGYDKARRQTEIHRAVAVIHAVRGSRQPQRKHRSPKPECYGAGDKQISAEPPQARLPEGNQHHSRRNRQLDKAACQRVHGRQK